MSGLHIIIMNLRPNSVAHLFARALGAQAAAEGKALAERGLSFQRVVCSDLKRAHETANILASVLCPGAVCPHPDAA